VVVVAEGGEDEEEIVKEKTNYSSGRPERKQSKAGAEGRREGKGVKEGFRKVMKTNNIAETGESAG